MKNTNVLIIGGDGRAHALAWKMMQSPQAGIIYVAPGNPGTAMLGCQNIPLSPVPENFATLADLACHLKIRLAVIGPDNALANGIVNYFKNRGIPTFGPSGSWIIEASKSYAKELMRDCGIPTADFEVFTDHAKALECVRSRGFRVVIKADGLAFGKGVRPCHSVQEAEKALEDFMINKTLGKAGEKVVIEDFLEGKELSIHALSDGTHVKLFPPVRDHKRLLDGDHGPMTGGMGVCGPIEVEAGLMEKIKREIVLPCIEELADRNLPFVGCLYPGIMLTKDGPKVLEFNARFGDPEAQVYMRLLDDDVDLIDVFLACVNGTLNTIDLRWKDQKCVCITLAAEGYPENPRKGDIVSIEHAMFWDNRYMLFHAGTAWKDGNLVTNGGRVISVTALANNNERAKKMLGYGDPRFHYVLFNDMQYRKDIGKVW